MFALITAPVLNLQAIPYNLNTKTLYITRLHLINNQQRILALLFLSISIIIKPIQNKRLWLFIKDKYIKIINLRESLLVLSYIKQSPLKGLLICYYSCLLSYFIYSSFGLIIYTINKRLKAAFSQQTMVIQAPLAL